MAKKNTAKRNFLTSLVATGVSMSMLVGTTFAWFTDSVTSSGNIIKSGTLDVTMEWADGKNDPTATDWTDASKGEIFKNELWEPGYAEVRHIKISNVGTLALKYEVNIIANGEVSDLADVIDVYYMDPAKQVTSRSDLNEDAKIGTLSEVLEGMSLTANGELKTGENDTVTIALKMQESAGNKYQNKSIGSDFAVQLLATQYTFEEDGFGDDQYDKNAGYNKPWDGVSTIAPVKDEDGVYHITNAAELVGLMDVTGNSIFIGDTIVLENDIDLAGKTVNGIGGQSNFAGTFDGQGFTISNFKIDATDREWYAGLFNYVGNCGTVKNLTVKNATVIGTSQVGAVAGGVNGGGSNDSSTIDNCKAIDCTVIGVKKVGAVVGYSMGSTVTNNYAENCTVVYSVDNEAGKVLGYENTGSIVANNTHNNVTVTKGTLASDANTVQEALASGAEYVGIADDMTLAAGSLKGASSDLTVDLAANTTVTVSSGVTTGSSAASKDLTFTGDKSSTVVFENKTPGYEGKLSYLDGVNLTFEGITFDASQISGICARGGEVTFNDCFITGELEQTIASKFVFSGCTFDVGVTQVGYGCTDVSFKDCTFETDGYGIKIYKEANEKIVNLTVTNCSFKNTGSEARSAILLDHIIDGFTYNIEVVGCTFEGYTKTPTATYNKWAERMIVADSFKTANGQYVFSYQTGVEGGNYHKILTAEQLVVTVK